ncbi:MAG: hypothetical protein U1F65_01865 [Verrucomicrobiota bacterium]
MKNPYKHIIEDSKWFKRVFKNVPHVPIALPPDIKRQQERIADRIQEIPKEFRELSIELAKRGWYLNMDMPFKFLFSLRGVLKANKPKKIDATLMDYVEYSVEKIENEVLSVFPKRAQILSAAFRAHSQKAYTLSVPVFLAQADGICSELLGVSLYARSKGVPHTASTVERFKNDELLSSLLEPLRIAGALNAYPNEKHEYRDILNRHEILHGKSLDYATELNSFRAISLLSYLCSVVQGAFWFEEVEEEMKEFRKQQPKS